jgi:hypothetical protein
MRSLRGLVRAFALTAAVLAVLFALRLLAARAAGSSQLAAASGRFEAAYGPMRSDLVDERVSEEANAAPLLVEAGRRLTISRSELELIGTCEERPASVSEAEVRARLAALASTNDGSLALVDRAASRPRALFSPRRGLLRDGSFETAVNLTKASRLVRALGEAAIEMRDDQALSLQLERLATLTVALRDQRALGFLFPALRSEESLLGLLHERAHRSVSPDLADRWLGIIARLEAAPDLREVLATEAAVSDAINTVSAESGGLGAEPWYSIWTNDHWRAEFLNGYSAVAGHLESPAALWALDTTQPREGAGRWWVALLNLRSKPEIFRWMILPSLRESIDVSQQVDALRELAVETLRSASGRASDQLPHVAWTDERVQRRVIGDRVVELSLPVAVRTFADRAAQFDASDPRHANLQRAAARMVWVVVPASSSS